MATFTDVLWSFTYGTGGICWLEDGAVRFATGACLSPSAAGFYWFCNSPTPGTCAGTNVSIFSELSPCLPAPSCVAQAVTFQMQFFRDCFGNTGGGCTSGTCIGAASPWTMVIQGHTLEFTNPGAEFSLSANTICFGQTISATSNGISYGVPAYSENWSFSSTGIPSVGSGSNPTISFPSAGTYTLFYIVTDGCAQTASANQVVTVNPLPTLTVTSAPNPICLGQSSVLAASGASTYTWSANAGGGTGPSKTVTPPVGTTVYTVNATSASGCVKSGTVSVTVNPLPSVTAVASPTIVCSGSPSTLTASGAITYTWSANAGSVTTSTATASPTATATYTVIGADLNSCTATATVVVSVTPSPTLTSSATTPTICVGQSDTLSVSGATSYTWMPGGANTSTLSVTPALTTSYTVIGDNGGICTAIQTVVITVNPLPSLTVTAGPPTICTGSSSTLTATGATTYTWSANAGSATTSTVVVTPSTNDNYTVTATLNGCKDSANVSVFVVPQPTVSIVSTQTLICSGNLDTLTASGATTYTWMPGAANTNTVSVSPGVTTTYTLYGASGACIDSTTFTLNVNPTPTITIVATPGAICSGQSSTLTASGISTVTWTPGGIVSNTISVSPGATTTYMATGDSLGCISTQVTVVSVTPQPTVAIASTQTLICSGNIDTLTASGATTYTWMPGASNTSTVSVSPGVTTTYTLVGANGACLDSTTFTLNVNPTPTITVSTSLDSLCSGDSDTLTVSGNATSYGWAPSTGLNVTTGTVVIAAPSVTTTYTVTGTIGSCSSVDTIRVKVNPLPLVTTINQAISLCAGQSATLTANGAVTYTWTPGNLNGQSVVVTPTVNTTYSVIGTDANGCSSIGWNLSYCGVTVNPTPTLTPVASQTVCGGDSVAAITFTISPGANVNWTNSNASIGISANGSGNILGYVAPTVSSQQIGVITATPVDLSTSCVGTTETFTVTVNPTPVILVLTPTPTVCSGQSAGMVAGGATTYTWSANAGGVITPNAIVTPTVTTTYSVIGAIGTCTATATQTIGVTTTPTITTNSPAPICSGQSATITATYAPVGCTIGWLPGGSTADSIVVSPGTTTPYTVTATNGGCSASATPILVVNPTPTLTISSPAFQKVCNPNLVAPINFSSDPAGTVVGWTNTNTAIGIVASGTTSIAGYTSPIVTTSQTGVLTIAAADPGSGCASASQTYTVTINPQPAISGSAIKDTAFCGLSQGGIKNLSASGGTGSLSYQWTPGGGTTLSLTNVASGTYTLVVTDSLGCTATSNYTVPGTAPVVASFTASAYTGTAPVSITFTNGSVGATGYSWNFGDGGSSSLTNPSHTYQQGGTYQVILTATAPHCMDTAIRTIIIEQPITVTVPNIFSPNGDGINEDFEIITSGVTELTCDIFNRWGQKVFTIGTVIGKWDGKLNNGNTASEGTYFYALIAKSYDGKQHKQQGSITLVR